MQKQRGDAWQRHHNNRAGISTSPWKSRCFDTRLNPASDPRVASCLGEAGVDAQAQLLAAASPQLRDSPILRCWPCLTLSHAAANGMEPTALPELDLVAGCVI